MNNRLRHHLAVFAVFALLLAGGIAVANQTQQGPPPPIIVIDKVITAPQNPGAFGRSAPGDFDGDLRPDLAILRGGLLEFVGSPGVYGWWAHDYPQLGSVNDLACISKEPAEPTDALVLVGDQGLSHCTEFGNMNPFNKHSMPTVAPLGGPDWNDARLVEVHAIPGDPKPRIFGVMADGLSLRQVRHDGTSYAYDEPISLSVPLPEPAVELQLVNFDGDPAGTPELAIATASALTIYWLDGTYAIRFMYPGTSTTAMVRGTSGTPAEWVAWTTELPDGSEWMRIVDGTGPKAPTLIPGQPGVVGLSPILWGGSTNDDQTDLVFSLSDTNEFWIAINQGVETFDLTAGQQSRHTFSFIPPPGYSGPPSQGVAASADLDGDGDQDLMCPVQALSMMTVSLNDYVDEVAQQPRLSVTGSIGDPEVSSLGCPTTPDDVGLTYEITVPSVGDTLGVVVWRKSQNAMHTNPRAISSFTFGPNSPELQSGLVSFALNNPAFSSTPTCNDPSEVQFDNVYFWEHYMMTTDPATGQVLEIHPSQFFGIETEATAGINRTYLLGHLIEGAEALTTTWSGSPDLFNEIVVGSTCQTPCLPDLPSNEPVIR